MFLNPYSYIAGGVALLSVLGGLAFQNHQIHHYHVAYNSEVTHSAHLEDQINTMTLAQNTQTTSTQKEVTKVVQGPETVKTVIKQIHDAPEPKNCVTPTLPEDVENQL